MIDDNLIQLSFQQLEEIQSRISQVILEKRSARIADAIKDVLNLLNTHYADVSLWDFLNELADTYQDNSPTSSVSIDLGEQSVLEPDIGSELDSNHWVPPSSCSDPLERPCENMRHQPLKNLPQANLNSQVEEIANSHNSVAEQECDIPLLYDPGMFYERLRVIKNEVLQHEEARLIWLTNDGSQKTSKVSGKALAELLQETIKKLERLCETEIETEISVEDLNREVLKISEWSEMHLGVSLRKGTLTVITPFASRELPPQGYSPMLTIADMCHQSDRGKLHIPFS